MDTTRMDKGEHVTAYIVQTCEHRSTMTNLRYHQIAIPPRFSFSMAQLVVDKLTLSQREVWPELISLARSDV